MRNSLISFVAGVVVASLAAWWNWPSSDQKSARVSATSNQTRQIRADEPNPAKIASPAVFNDANANKPEPGLSAARSTSAPSSTSVPTSVPTSATTQASQRGAARLPGLPAPAPIQLSTDHANLIAPPKETSRPLSIQELHLRLGSESPDPAWGPTLENQLSQHLRRAAPPPEFEIIAILCRATLCQIQAFGNLPSSGAKWNDVVAGMGQEPWWQPNVQGASTTSNEVNGRAVIITILHRAVPR